MLNNEQELFALFARLGIVHDTVTHLPVFNAEDEARLNIGQWEFPVKNFFVCDKKKKFYLLTVHLKTPPVDLTALGKTIGASGRLSFAKEEGLATHLRVRPGSVTPYAVFHDTGHAVTVLLDDRLQQSGSISAHPMRNDQTTTISCADLAKFYTHTGHTPRYVTVPLRAIAAA